ncbi:MAG: PQQ-binding-like beta-propeller repeat protein [Candidatus Bathyarchaeota archaeon]|nr:PQQ-binding-like beta-propeller repeat protein [Candidatus Bathyarchaeota archaeon]
MKTIAIALCIILAVSSWLALVPTVGAHTPPWNIPTFAFINVAPNPVGVGQQALIVVWLDKIPDGASITNNIRFHNYKCVITAPDGKTETKTWDVVTDTTSSAFTSFVPDQVGTYTFNFTFPGQKYTDYEYSPTSAFVNDTYLPSSATTTLTVQEDPVSEGEFTPLPTEYWTRPIEGQNSNWYTIGSNYLYPLGAAYSFGSVRYVPDGTAPDNSHIMWSKSITFGGIVGGNNEYAGPNSPSSETGITGVAYYTGLSYETKFNTPIIISGRLYYGLPRSNAGSGGGYICVDLRTGKEIWRQNYTVNPSFGAVIDVETPNQHGAISYLIATQTVSQVTTWMMYDPWDGNWVFNITNVPSGTMSYGPSGEPIIYQINLASKWLALWNFTSVVSNGPINALLSTGYRPVGNVFNTTLRLSYSWNVTLPTLPTSNAGIGWAINDDLLLGYANMRSSFGQPTWGGVAAASTAYGTVWAVSLKPGSRGTLLWTKDIQVPPGNITLQLGTVDIKNRMFFVSTKETMQWYGYDLDSGNQKWGPVGNTRAFNYYPTVGSGGVAQIGYVAYGKLYVGGYGGEVFCYETTTGKLLWSYGGGGEGNSTNSGAETSWGLYPVFIGAIADGKIYVYSNEHSPNTPLYRDEKLRCLNATTGEELWILDSWACVGGFADFGFPIADGQLSYLNAYDMKVYSIGKGPSAMTVTAPNIATTVGTPIVIRGTVTDIAAGTTQDEQAARFPNGVACVADESMSAWMEYVYMQKSKPTDAKGVKVSLDVIDANGNYRNIGTTTSDASGMFTYAWAPDIPGSYTVIASFTGSNSYYGSYAETSFYAVDAPAAATAQPTQEPSMADLYFVPAIAGLFVLVIILLVLMVLMMMKKRP